MLWWEETDSDVNPQYIVIVSALVNLLIPHIDGLRVTQLFLWWIVVSRLGITFVLNILVFK